MFRYVVTALLLESETHTHTPPPLSSGHYIDLVTTEEWEFSETTSFVYSSKLDKSGHETTLVLGSLYCSSGGGFGKVWPVLNGARPGSTQTQHKF